MNSSREQRLESEKKIQKESYEAKLNELKEKENDFFIQKKESRNFVESQKKIAESKMKEIEKRENELNEKKLQFEKIVLGNQIKAQIRIRIRLRSD